MSSEPSNIDPSMQPPITPNRPSQFPQTSLGPISQSEAKTKLGTDGFNKFKAFLGPEGYKQFMSILCMMIASQLNKETIQMKKASQDLKDSLTGNDN